MATRGPHAHADARARAGGSAWSPCSWPRGAGLPQGHAPQGRGSDALGPDVWPPGRTVLPTGLRRLCEAGRPGAGVTPGSRPSEQWQPLLRAGAWWAVSCPGVPPSGPLPRVDTPSSVWRAGGGLGAVLLRRWVFPCPLGRTGQGGPPVVAPQAWGPRRRRCVQVAQVGPAPRPGTVDLHICTHTHATDLPRTHVRTRAGHAPTCAHTRPLPPRSPQASALR